VKSIHQCNIDSLKPEELFCMLAEKIIGCHLEQRLAGSALKAEVLGCWIDSNLPGRNNLAEALPGCNTDFHIGMTIQTAQCPIDMGFLMTVDLCRSNDAVRKTLLHDSLECHHDSISVFMLPLTLRVQYDFRG